MHSVPSLLVACSLTGKMSSWLYLRVSLHRLGGLYEVILSSMPSVYLSVIVWYLLLVRALSEQIASDYARILRIANSVSGMQLIRTGNLSW